MYLFFIHSRSLKCIEKTQQLLYWCIGKVHRDFGNSQWDRNMHPRLQWHLLDMGVCPGIFHMSKNLQNYKHVNVRFKHSISSSQFLAPEAIENLNIWGMSYILRPPQIQWLPSKLALSWVWMNTSYRLSPSSGKSVLTSPSTTWACTTGCPLNCKCKTHWNRTSTKYMNWTFRNQMCKSVSASFSIS